MRVESVTSFQPNLEPIIAGRGAPRESCNCDWWVHGNAAGIVSLGLQIRVIQEQGLQRCIRQISLPFPFSRMRDLWLIPMLSSQYRVQTLLQRRQGTRAVLINKLEPTDMKKIVLATMACVALFAAVAPAYAYDHHHHPVCHKVRVHHHWEKRCH